MHDKQRDQVYQNDDTSKLNILHKVYKIHTKLSIIYSNFLSPCSGLVVSGFSKRDPPDITEKGFLAKAIDSYKKFKKMYVVDNTTDPLLATDDFIGKI